eukprot:76174_1
MLSRIIKRSSMNSNLLYLSNRALTGSSIPSGSFFRLGESGPEQVTTDDLFKNKKVVLFGFPGAFTGTCQNQQVPSFNLNAPEFKKLGVDSVLAMSSGDVFVLKAFQESTQATDLQFIQDFNVSFSTSLGKTFDGSGKGLGVRNTRFALYAENGEVKCFFEEDAPAEFKKTDADTLLDAIKSVQK